MLSEVRGRSRTRVETGHALHESSILARRVALEKLPGKRPSFRHPLQVDEQSDAERSTSLRENSALPEPSLPLFDVGEGALAVGPCQVLEDAQIRFLARGTTHLRKFGGEDERRRPRNGTLRRTRERRAPHELSRPKLGAHPDEAERSQERSGRDDADDPIGETMRHFSTS